MTPSLDWETRLWSHGYRTVAGLDEAGRGAWAGPVVAAAVILPPAGPRLLARLQGVADSKLLPPARRLALSQVITCHALAVGVGAVPAAAIDALGIAAATRQAMVRALLVLSPPADCLLIDYLRLPEVPLPQECMPHGDALVLSIAAASIVAKVSRDRMMAGLEATFPGYGFAHHKGYGTAEHRAALARLGPSAVHRLSFAPLHSGAPGPGRVKWP